MCRGRVATSNVFPWQYEWRLQRLLQKIRDLGPERVIQLEVNADNMYQRYKCKSGSI